MVPFVLTTSTPFSVCEDGRRQVCEEALLPVLVELLQDEDVEVQANAAGVIMYTGIITAGTSTHREVLKYTP